MKRIPTREAAGHVLCHDMTQIIPGRYKGARFRKGHVVREEDIPVLLSMGKEHLYVWELVPGMVHETTRRSASAPSAGTRAWTGARSRRGKSSSPPRQTACFLWTAPG